MDAGPGSGLRARLLLVEETLQETELAAAQRWNDALSLLTAARYAGAVYLMGYVAEILLKNAVFRRLGARPSDQIAVYRFRARSTAKSLELSGHEAQRESGHGLRYWARLIWVLPSASGKMLEDATKRSLCRHVLRAEAAWCVEMRYFSDPSSRDEALAMLRSVEWIRRHRVTLWS